MEGQGSTPRNTETYVLREGDVDNYSDMVKGVPYGLEVVRATEPGGKRRCVFRPKQFYKREIDRV